MRSSSSFGHREDLNFAHWEQFLAYVGGGASEQVLVISQAIDKLGRFDERLLKVADLHVILGLELSDIANALGISEPTFKREWRRVKAYR